MEKVKAYRNSNEYFVIRSLTIDKEKKKIRYDTNIIVPLWQKNKRYGTDNKGY